MVTSLFWYSFSCQFTSLREQEKFIFSKRRLFVISPTFVLRIFLKSICLIILLQSVPDFMFNMSCVWLVSMCICIIFPETSTSILLDPPIYYKEQDLYNMVNVKGKLYKTVDKLT